MLAQTYKPRIRDYWTDFLPSKVEGRSQKELDQDVSATAKRVAEQVQTLMAGGYYQRHEAEEVAMAAIVYSEKPETDGLSEELREEAAEMERDYQKNVAPLLVLSDEDEDEA